MAEKQPKKVKKVVRKKTTRPSDDNSKDSFERFVSAVWENIFVPAGRTFLSDVLDTSADAGKSALRRQIFGEDDPVHERKVARGRSRNEVRNYNSVSRKEQVSNRSSKPSNDALFDSYLEAKEAADILYAKLDEYGVVTLADLYDLAGIQPKYTDDKWGWVSLRGGKIAHDYRTDAYFLKLPDPEPLER